MNFVQEQFRDLFVNMRADLCKMKETRAFIEAGMPGAMSYDDYYGLMERLNEEQKTTGEDQSEIMVNFTQLNYHRMKRLNKTIQLNQDLIDQVRKIDQPLTWLVLTEAWCGDVAQNIPLINTMADLNSNIDLRFILRDEHPSIMDEHLTNGGKSIPKLIVVDEDLKLLLDWGPRPEPVQDMVMQYRQMPEPKQPYIEFLMDVQKWYLKDRTQSFQHEFTALLKQVNISMLESK